jgi:hypothetical protein
VQSENWRSSETDRNPGTQLCEPRVAPSSSTSTGPSCVGVYPDEQECACHRSTGYRSAHYILAIVALGVVGDDSGYVVVRYVDDQGEQKDQAYLDKTLLEGQAEIAATDAF